MDVNDIPNSVPDMFFIRYSNVDDISAFMSHENIQMLNGTINKGIT